MELLKVLLRVSSDLHDRAGLDHLGDQLPLLLVRAESLQKHVMFFLRPTSGCKLRPQKHCKCKRLYDKRHKIAVARTGLVAAVHIVSFKLGIGLMKNGQMSVKSVANKKALHQKMP